MDRKAKLCDAPHMRLVTELQLGSRLGDFLRDGFNSGATSFRGAVAFLRASGMAHLKPLISNFSSTRPFELIVGVESNNTLPITPGATQTIQLWNWTTNSWEQLDSRAATPADSLAVVTVTSNPGRFIQATTREVRSRILHVAAVGETGNRWRMNFDMVGIQFN